MFVSKKQENISDVRNSKNQNSLSSYITCEVFLFSSSLLRAESCEKAKGLHAFHIAKHQNKI